MKTRKFLLKFASRITCVLSTDYMVRPRFGVILREGVGSCLVCLSPCVFTWEAGTGHKLKQYINRQTERGHASCVLQTEASKPPLARFQDEGIIQRSEPVHHS